jgi:F-type H+-transporting ATPase subunit beta
MITKIAPRVATPVEPALLVKALTWILHTSSCHKRLRPIVAQVSNLLYRGLEQLSPEDRNVVARARRLERFLTQPFFTTEQFTGLAGKLVSLADALDGCERILHDEFKDYPESALYMIGAIGEAKQKGTPAKPAAKVEPTADSKPGKSETPPQPKAKPQPQPESAAANHES